MFYLQGQPNRRTGVCEEDMFFMTGGNSSEFTLCGLNSGQHGQYAIFIMHETLIQNRVRFQAITS